MHLDITSWTTSYYDSQWLGTDADIRKANKYLKAMVKKLRQKAKTAQRECSRALPPIRGTATIQQEDKSSGGPLAYREIEFLLGIDVSGDKEWPLTVRARRVRMIEDAKVRSCDMKPMTDESPTVDELWISDLKPNAREPTPPSVLTGPFPSGKEKERRKRETAPTVVEDT